MVEQAKESRTQDTFRGLHRCSLCEAEGYQVEGLLDSHYNLFIPGASVVYVAPAGIMHYLQNHLYQPPDDFVVAVDLCPEYGSPAYLAALKEANGGCRTPFEVLEEGLRIMRETLQRTMEARRQRDP